MAKTAFKTRAVLFFIRLLATLPLSVVQWLGRWLGRLIYVLDAQPTRVARKNLEVCLPWMPATEREALCRRSLEETGKTLLEMGMVWEWPVARTLGLIRSVEGEELLSRRGSSQGLLFLSPHLGNWELVGLYLASRFPMAALYAPPKLDGLDDYMRRVRERNGSTLVPATQRGVIQLFSILRGNGVVGVLPDQEPELSGGVFVPFFGVPANTMKLVSKMVQKTAPRVIVCVAYRLPESAGFKVVFSEVDSDLYSPDTAVSVEGLNRTVERVIMLHPEQYQWVYKRFKRRPEGLPGLYP